MKNLVVRFVKNESGATAIEYGLIAAGISVAIIAVVNGLGTKLNTTFAQHFDPAQVIERVVAAIKAPASCRSLFVFGGRLPALKTSRANRNASLPGLV